MSIVLEIIADFLAFVVPDFIGEGGGTDRRLLKLDKVRSRIRAFDGRVLNIGTEWSTGVCEISPGHLRFVPSMGIVGDREIEVTGFRLMEGGPYERVIAPWGESADFIIETKAGELYWVVPKHLSDEVTARLSPLTVL